MKRHLIITGGFLIAVIVLMVTVTVFGVTAKGYAAKIIETCAVEGDKASCYEQEIPKLLGELTLEQVFEVIREVRLRDPSYQFCHVLAHGLGERVVAEDPEHWMDAMSKNPSDGLCSNGFIHGVVGGKFRAEVLDRETLEAFLPDFSRACEPREGWKPSLLDQAICYHGMGHLYVFITDAQLQDALSLCEKTAISVSGDFRRVCTEGVFMQIYQPLEPDDFLMIERMNVKPTKDTVRLFCASYANDEYEGACLRESWPFFREDLLSGGVERFCSNQPNGAEETACYESVFSIVGRQTLGNPNIALNVCAVAPAVRKNECYFRVAMSYLEENRKDARRAVSFCESAPEGRSSACLRSLIERAPFMFGDSRAQHMQFCGSLPVDIRKECVDRAQ